MPITKIAEFIARIILFLAYFCLSLVLFFGWNSNDNPRNKCLVQHTYRQEFLTSVASNPFFSSINVLRDAPLSKLERVAYGSANYTQNLSSITMFPVQIFNAADKAAFLTVYPEPGGLISPADDPILMPRRVFHFICCTFCMLCATHGADRGLYLQQDLPGWQKCLLLLQ